MEVKRVLFSSMNGLTREAGDFRIFLCGPGGRPMQIWGHFRIMPWYAGKQSLKSDFLTKRRRPSYIHPKHMRYE